MMCGFPITDLTQNGMSMKNEKQYGIKYVFPFIILMLFVANCSSITTTASRKLVNDTIAYNKIYIYFFEPPEDWTKSFGMKTGFTSAFVENLKNEFHINNVKVALSTIPVNALASDKQKAKESEKSFNGIGQLIIVPKKIACCAGGTRKHYYQIFLFNRESRQRVWEASMTFSVASDIFTAPFIQMKKETKIFVSEIINQMKIHKFIRPD